MKRLNVNLLSGLILAIILLGLISAVTVYVNAQTYRELAIASVALPLIKRVSCRCRAEFIRPTAYAPA